jgi:hypothetical protein
MTQGSPKLFQNPTKITRLNHWGIKEEVILQNTNDIKNIIQAKFKENICCDKELEGKKIKTL